MNLSSLEMETLSSIREEDNRLKIYISQNAGDWNKISSEIVKKSTGQYFVSFGKDKVFYKHALPKIMNTVNITTHMAVGVAKSDNLDIFSNYFKKVLHKKSDHHPSKYLLNSLLDIDCFVVSRFYYESINLPEAKKNIFDVGFYSFMLAQIGSTNFRTVPILVNHYQPVREPISLSMNQLAGQISLITSQFDNQIDWSSAFAKHIEYYKKEDFEAIYEFIVTQTLNDILQYWKYYTPLAKKQLKAAILAPLVKISKSKKLKLSDLPIHDKKTFLSFMKELQIEA